MKLSPLVDVSRECVSTAGDKVIVDYCYGHSRFMLCRFELLPQHSRQINSSRTHCRSEGGDHGDQREQQDYCHVNHHVSSTHSKQVRSDHRTQSKRQYDAHDKTRHQQLQTVGDHQPQQSSPTSSQRGPDAELVPAFGHGMRHDSVQANGAEEK